MLPIINATWSGDVLLLVRRNAEGVRAVEKRAAEHCIILQSDAPREIVSALQDSRLCRGARRDGDWWRFVYRYERENWDEPAAHVRVAKHVEESMRVSTYEADVSPVRRLLTDEAVEILHPRGAYFDIETDSRVPFARKHEARVLCWVIVSDDGEQCIASVLADDNDDAERDLLLRFWECAAQFDQLRGWNSDRFDRPMLEARSRKLGVNVNTRLWLWLDHMVLYKRMNAHAAKSGAEKQSFALDAIGKSLGIGGKTEGVDGSQSWELWSSKRGALLDYCHRDTDLMRLIEGKTGYVALLQTLCDATFCLADTHGINPTEQVEGFLFRLGRERGMHFRSYFGTDEVEKFDGAYVMQPEFKGIARDVHVADFAGMYPSIITSWNLSPETYRPDIRLRESELGRPSYLMHVPLKEFPLPDGHCKVPLVDHVFVNEPKGILPFACDRIGELRAYWQKLKASLPPGTPEWNDADRKADAYKIARNSFYGVIGSPLSRFYLREVAESTAQAGVWLAKKTIEFFERAGLFVGYGDTDSQMATGCSEEQFRELVGRCNAELYPALLRECACARNEVKLEYEKQFDRIVFVAAKKYVGRFLHYKGKRALADSEPEVKGLEWKRGDVSRLTRELQGEVIALLMAGDALPQPDVFVPVIEAWKLRVLEGALTVDDVKVSKRLSKSLREYTVRLKKDGSPMSEPPHVRVARMLKTRGLDVGEGTKVDYVVTDGVAMLVAPAQDFDEATIDRHYVWEKMVYPATMRLLAAAFGNFDWSKWAVSRPVRLAAIAARVKRGETKKRVARTKAAQTSLAFGPVRHDADDDNMEACNETQERIPAGQPFAEPVGGYCYDDNDDAAEC